MITINQKHLDTRKQICKDKHAFYMEVKTKMFQSFDKKFLEKLVNEFLDDAILLDYHYYAIYKDTSDIPEFSDKVILKNHVVVLEYLEWPF